MKNRLFIALKLPEEISEEIVVVRKSINDDPSRKWESKDKIHLTLKFLGDVEEDRADEITDTLEKVLRGKTKIKCAYDRFGFFLPRILWIGLTVDKSLIEIVSSLEEEFGNLGFQKESRNFKPHITLLRIKDRLDHDFVSAFSNFKLPGRIFHAEDISLMKSKLMPSGSVYSVIKNYKLH